MSEEHLSPEEILEGLYTQEDVTPNHYVEWEDIPVEGNEIQMKGKLPIGVDQGVAAQVCRTPLISPKCNTNLHEILKGKINHLPNMFLAMAQEAADKNLPSSTLVIGLCGDDTSGVLPGQYISQIWLVIHRMSDEKKIEESLPVPGQPGLRED